MAEEPLVIEGEIEMYPAVETVAVPCFIPTIKGKYPNHLSDMLIRTFDIMNTGLLLSGGPRFVLPGCYKITVERIE